MWSEYRPYSCNQRLTVTTETYFVLLPSGRNCPINNHDQIITYKLKVTQVFLNLTLSRNSKIYHKTIVGWFHILLRVNNFMTVGPKFEVSSNVFLWYTQYVEIRRY